MIPDPTGSKPILRAMDLPARAFLVDASDPSNPLLFGLADISAFARSSAFESVAGKDAPLSWTTRACVIVDHVFHLYRILGRTLGADPAHVSSISSRPAHLRLSDPAAGQNLFDPLFFIASAPLPASSRIALAGALPFISLPVEQPAPDDLSLPQALALAETFDIASRLAPVSPPPHRPRGL